MDQFFKRKGDEKLLKEPSSSSESNIIEQDVLSQDEKTTWEENFRKRYCVSKKCGFHFSVGHPFTKQFSRRCLKCSGPTIFVIHS
jgi:hypothetical protein